MSTCHRFLRPRRDRSGLLAEASRRVPGWRRATSFTAVATALVFAVLAMPANAEATLASGVGVFDDTCQPPVGSPPGNPGDYPPIAMSGSLDGCWYTYVSASRFNPSGTYVEQGTELFVGCLDGMACGTFETVYTFTGKYTDDTFAEEIHGRCEHRIVGGTGDFAGAKGVINFKDDVVNLVFDYRGPISLASSEQADAAVAQEDAAKLTGTVGPTRSGGC